MFVMANLVNAIASILDIALTLYLLCVFAAVIISWFMPRSRHGAVLFLRRLTEPVLGWVRRAMPFVRTAGFDFSPIIVFFAVYFIRAFVVRSLYDLASRLR